MNIDSRPSIPTFSGLPQRRDGSRSRTSERCTQRPFHLDYRVTVGDRDDATGSRREGVQGLQRDVERVRAQHDARRSRHPHAFETAPVSKPCRHVENELAERDAARDLYDPRTVYRTRHTEEPGRALTLTGTPAAALGDHRRKGGESLDVADHGRLPPEARFVRTRRPRRRPRRGSLALDRPEKRLLLSPDKPASPPPDLHMEGKRRAENPITDEARRSSLGAGPGHPLKRETRGSVDVDDAPVRSGRIGSDQ